MRRPVHCTDGIRVPWMLLQYNPTPPRHRPVCECASARFYDCSLFYSVCVCVWRERVLVLSVFLFFFFCFYSCSPSSSSPERRLNFQAPARSTTPQHHHYSLSLSCCPALRPTLTISAHLLPLSLPLNSSSLPPPLLMFDPTQAKVKNGILPAHTLPMTEGNKKENQCIFERNNLLAFTQTHTHQHNLFGVHALAHSSPYRFNGSELKQTNIRSLTRTRTLNPSTLSSHEQRVNPTEKRRKTTKKKIERESPPLCFVAHILTGVQRMRVVSLCVHACNDVCMHVCMSWWNKKKSIWKEPCVRAGWNLFQQHEPLPSDVRKRENS